jgi:hypothetical protein
MQYRKLGNTSLNVSAICLGTMTWGEQNSVSEAHQQLDYATDAGINFIDTAPVYGFGESEKLIGKNMQNAKQELINAKEAIKKNEFHIAALESDAGGFSPRGFTFDADTSVLKKYYKKVSSEFLPLLESYGLLFETGGSGADIGPLKPLKGLLIGLRPDSQRYFDFHHTSRDNIEAVNPRELKMGAAAMTSLVYLIDKYGLTE